MENTNELNRKIADNLIRYRKQAGYTQAELAEKINYSDKSVSKWEQGNGIPDVYTLVQLAELYGVSVDALLSDGVPVPTRKKTKGLHVLIMLLTCGIAWLVAICFFVVMAIWKPNGAWWLAFLYAVMANAISLIVYAGIWKYRVLNFCAVSTLIWVSITCLFLTIRAIVTSFGGDTDGLGLLFLLGVPLQVLEILWVFFRSLFCKNKDKKKKMADAEESNGAVNQ